MEIDFNSHVIVNYGYVKFAARPTNDINSPGYVDLVVAPSGGGEPMKVYGMEDGPLSSYEKGDDVIVISIYSTNGQNYLNFIAERDLDGMVEEAARLMNNIRHSVSNQEHLPEDESTTISQSIFRELADRGAL